ncbi:hypothetical protein JKP88DRAFT_250916 [Tribonema minus]|uniref:Uncharacterized protein n=1 Tax=Tribonema minus TaxID=303371 RepID=A0A836CQY2_9STRA|nr:hypothetical protein JKP88DRAFT_250916 [Tribonema minus]
MALATDDVGMARCVRPTMEAPACDATWTKDAVIRNREIQFTTRILAAGYSVAALILGFRGVDISLANGAAVAERCRSTARGAISDVYLPNNYGPRADVSPLEVMYFKTNRGVQDALLEAYTRWVDPHFYEERARSAFLARSRRCDGGAGAARNV